MSYKTVLSYCDAAAAKSKTIDVAAELAMRFKGHVVGLHVKSRFEAPMYMEGNFALDSLMKAHEQSVADDESKAATAFRKVVDGKTLSSEWRSIEGFAEDEVATAARYADLVVVGQTDEPRQAAATPTDLPERIALSTGRPVMIVPHIGILRPPGRNVMLCWNASREAAHAATAALPLLVKADKVIVLIVDPKKSTRGHGDEPGADVARWLVRHGVKVTVQRDTAADSDVGGVILSRAADHDIDLIVMGLYGHSRLHEMVLGGASRTLLASMTVPLLVAH